MTQQRRLSVEEQNQKIQDSALEMVAYANSDVTPSRMVTFGAASEVVRRSLAENDRYGFAMRSHKATVAISDFINVWQKDKTNLRNSQNTDLLPVGHPQSTKPHAMTASALRNARARWHAGDPRITNDEARPIVAALLSSDPNSIEFEYFSTRLASFPQGSLPLETLLAAIGDGNSSAARSARARAQRRDRKGRFAWQGGGLSAFVRMRDGIVRRLSGRMVAAGVGGDDTFDVELEDGRIYRVPAQAAEAVKAFLPSPDAPKGFSPQPAQIDAGDPVVNIDDLQLVDAPNGFRKDDDYDGPGERFLDDAYAVYKYPAGSPDAPEVEGADPAKPTYEVRRLDGDKESSTFEVGQSWAAMQDAIRADEPKRDAEEGREPDPVAVLDDKQYDDLMENVGDGDPREYARGLLGQKERPAAQETSQPLEFDGADNNYYFDVNEDYEPRGLEDQEAEDYTDDPAELANKFNEMDLRDALEEAVIGNRNEEAGGVAQMPFDGGLEDVPAEAIYAAMREKGMDAEMELAEIYDGNLGGRPQRYNQDLVEERRAGREEQKAELPAPKNEEEILRNAKFGKAEDLDREGFDVVLNELERRSKENVRADAAGIPVGIGNGYLAGGRLQVRRYDKMDEQGNLYDEFQYEALTDKERITAKTRDELFEKIKATAEGPDTKPSLPALLDGLSEQEKADFEQSGDYKPYLPKNEPFDAPEGYWPEMDGDAFENVDEDPNVDPLNLAQNVDQEDLEAAYREALEPNSQLAGYGSVPRVDENGEEVVDSVPAEAIRDALQLQGVDTNELNKTIADEAAEGQQGPLDDAEAADILEQAEADAADAPEEPQGAGLVFRKPDNRYDVGREFSENYVNYLNDADAESLTNEELDHIDMMASQVALWNNDRIRGLKEKADAERARREDGAGPEASEFDGDVFVPNKIATVPMAEVSQEDRDRAADLAAELGYSEEAQDLIRNGGEQQDILDALNAQEVPGFAGNMRNPYQDNKEDYDNRAFVDMPRRAQREQWDRFGEFQKVIDAIGMEPPKPITREDREDAAERSDRLGYGDEAKDAIIDGDADEILEALPEQYAADAKAFTEPKKQRTGRGSKRKPSDDKRMEDFPDFQGFVDKMLDDWGMSPIPAGLNDEQAAKYRDLKRRLRIAQNGGLVTDPDPRKINGRYVEPNPQEAARLQKEIDDLLAGAEAEAPEARIPSTPAAPAGEKKPGAFYGVDPDGNLDLNMEYTDEYVDYLYNTDPKSMSTSELSDLKNLLSQVSPSNKRLVARIEREVDEELAARAEMGPDAEAQLGMFEGKRFVNEAFDKNEGTPSPFFQKDIAPNGRVRLDRKKPYAQKYVDHLLNPDRDLNDLSDEELNDLYNILDQMDDDQYNGPNDREGRMDEIFDLIREREEGNNIPNSFDGARFGEPEGGEAEAEAPQEEAPAAPSAPESAGEAPQAPEAEVAEAEEIPEPVEVPAAPAAPESKTKKRRREAEARAKKGGAGANGRDENAPMAPELKKLRKGRQRVQRGRGEALAKARDLLNKFMQDWDARGNIRPRPTHRIVSRDVDPALAGDADYRDINGNIIREGDIIAHRRDGALVNPEREHVNVILARVLRREPYVRNGVQRPGGLIVEVLDADKGEWVERKDFLYVAGQVEIIEQPDLKASVEAEDAAREIPELEQLQFDLWRMDNKQVYAEYDRARAEGRADKLDVISKELTARNVLVPQDMADFLDALDDSAIDWLREDLGLGEGVHGDILRKLIANERDRRARGEQGVPANMPENLVDGVEPAPRPAPQRQQTPEAETPESQGGGPEATPEPSPEPEAPAEAEAEEIVPEEPAEATMPPVEGIDEADMVAGFRAEGNSWVEANAENVEAKAGEVQINDFIRSLNGNYGRVINIKDEGGRVRITVEYANGRQFEYKRAWNKETQLNGGVYRPNLVNKGVAPAAPADAAPAAPAAPIIDSGKVYQDAAKKVRKIKADLPKLKDAYGGANYGIRSVHKALKALNEGNGERFKVYAEHAIKTLSRYPQYADQVDRLRAAIDDFDNGLAGVEVDRQNNAPDLEKVDVLAIREQRIADGENIPEVSEANRRYLAQEGFAKFDASLMPYVAEIQDYFASKDPKPMAALSPEARFALGQYFKQAFVGQYRFNMNNDEYDQMLKDGVQILAALQRERLAYEPSVSELDARGRELLQYRFEDFEAAVRKGGSLTINGRSTGFKVKRSGYGGGAKGVNLTLIITDTTTGRVYFMKRDTDNPHVRAEVAGAEMARGMGMLGGYYAELHPLHDNVVLMAQAGQNLDINGKIDIAGALTRDEQKFAQDNPLQAAMMVVQDAALGNVDRHMANYVGVRDRNPINGQDAGLLPIAIDNGLAAALHQDAYNYNPNIGAATPVEYIQKNKGKSEIGYYLKRVVGEAVFAELIKMSALQAAQTLRRQYPPGQAPELDVLIARLEEIAAASPSDLYARPQNRP